ncbi:hypothetical protein COW36_21180 [bacterium (Candidatus Blackallbacteria) CG17_big_fil_post_rev_8_21_14_2_50_48_46]|uniref:Tetratricopeptide repeat protein n=1 Tax=bacterium (Candidatus Blackallbacteria) CG17_big_fil_post_rev_8_21_14_2_50_48_46 TaxID=2014261 RepID=A0A2M7FYV1_9BACT|nr:MAG: hypothetical protein COW64_14490 [bacterium (Candidatus Blackallbacteria) CG18_big_fil_WC_8_21_14_2_50_49_26]PIW14554.1 MAG: hypothetical protein COW36_21180 [bacterium (Candidatus Blackallbacteria) CG17_big_fil_post_rev_8_21_14_2_50_48_46]PIW47239.1 MAG: hypothetical protein COW20_13625 [bacterium (Candidatus Blackallbacteria) CG13_big_fil_rev_8_21_14_2_50_49_14]
MCSPLEKITELVQTSQWDQAWELCQASLKTSSQNPELWVMQGYLSLEKRDPQTALQSFLEALEQLLTAQDLKATENLLAQVQPLFPNLPVLSQVKARLLLKQKQWQAAHQTFCSLSKLPQGALPFEELDLSPTPLSVYPFEVQHQQTQLSHLLSAQALSSEYRQLQSHWQNLANTLQTHPPFQACDISSPGSRWLKQAFYAPSLPEFESVINPALDTASIENRFLESGWCTLDELLIPEALASLQRYALQATIWHKAYANGYLGASWLEGYHPQLLFQLAAELPERLPQIFKGLTLKNMWAIICDQRSQGTGVHGDEATLNLNLWLTPTSANQDLHSGGLIIYDQPAPAAWSFVEYNQADKMPEIYAYLKATGAKAQRVAYRQNRAVLFRSDFFHESDHLNFKAGFENQRITSIQLFGEKRTPS